MFIQKLVIWTNIYLFFAKNESFSFLYKNSSENLLIALSDDFIFDWNT